MLAIADVLACNVLSHESLQALRGISDQSDAIRGLHILARKKYSKTIWFKLKAVRKGQTLSSSSNPNILTLEKNKKTLETFLNSMENLPLEITANILSDLPMVLQLQCRKVCKTWRTLLPIPKMVLLFVVTQQKGTESEAEFYFSEQHSDNEQLGCFGTLTKLEHSLIMPASSLRRIMVGSCCGLVCYAGYTFSRTGHIVSLKEVYIYNPFTGEKIQFQTDEWDSDFWAEPAIGFGYNHSRDEYKVVRIVCSYLYGFGWVQVYTFNGCTGWKSKCSIINLPVTSNLSVLRPSVGVFAGGALHWIDRDCIKCTVVAFYLEHETFELLPSIPSDVVDYANVGLIVLGGNLCVLDVVPSKHVRIWELRSRKMWLPMFSIAWEDSSWFETFALTKSDKFFLWHNVILSSYDSETKMLRKLDETLKKLMHDCMPWVYTTTRAIRFMNPHVSEAIMAERKAPKETKK